MKTRPYVKINTRNRLIGTNNVYANNTQHNARAYRFAYSLSNAVLNHCTHVSVLQ